MKPDFLKMMKSKVADAGPAVAEAAQGMPEEKPMHKHKHKAHHGRASDNETGRRRNMRGGNPY